MKLLRNKIKSFSLIEVVVSVGIIAMILAALIGMSSMGAKMNVSTQRRLQAMNYARYGIEAVRQVRDNTKTGGCAYTFQTSSVWLNLSTTCGAAALTTHTQSEDYVQFIDDQGNWDTTGVKNKSGLGQTNYGSSILITKKDSVMTGLILVSSTITWKEGTSFKKITLDTYLASW